MSYETKTCTSLLEFCSQTLQSSPSRQEGFEQYMMFLQLKLFFIVSVLAAFASSSQDFSITYNGFSSAKLILDGIAEISPKGLLELTNGTKQEKGHAFYPDPVIFKNSPNGSVLSFSTSFVFAIQPQYPDLSGHGIAFVIAPQRGLPDALPSQYLGLFNKNNTGNDTNHVVAVELDTILSSEFKDINDNHVGIDINGLISEKSEPAGYHIDDGSFRNVSLISGKPMQVWVEYDSSSFRMDVTLAPVNVVRPKKPLLSLNRDLSLVLNQTMYIGFSSSTGSVVTSHYVLGWSFKTNGMARGLDLSHLPKLPRVGPKPKSKLLTIGLPIVLVLIFSVVMAGIIYHIRIKRKFAEVLEDWEREYGPHRFKYKDLHIATKGFRNKELLGSGGFGRVYRGVMAGSRLEVAVKKVSHESRQGMKEFVAEIASIGRMRHRNLVPLLGYCRRKGELLLVYEFMPNGSLDRFLYSQPEDNVLEDEQTLSWKRRFRIIKGVASGLFYLHEGWEQLVIHRDVKASNVLLDGEFNAKLGDFGLARLYDHGTDPQTTHVVGTLGYLAPEHTRTGRATASTDVYSFGAFLLEVVCGRRPIEPRASPEDAILVDRVVTCWNAGRILDAMDPKMADYVKEEVEMVMKLGLLCSHSEPDLRPSMRQVVLYLDGALALPELGCLGISSGGLRFGNKEGFSDFVHSYPSSMEKGYSEVSSATASTSLLSGGR